MGSGSARSGRWITGAGPDTTDSPGPCWEGNRGRSENRYKTKPQKKRKKNGKNLILNTCTATF